MIHYEIGGSDIFIKNFFNWQIGGSLKKFVQRFVDAGLWPSNHEIYIILGKPSKIASEIESMKDDLNSTLYDLIPKDPLNTSARTTVVNGQSLITVSECPFKASEYDYRKILNHEITHVVQLNKYEETIDKITCEVTGEVPERGESYFHRVIEPVINNILTCAEGMIDDHISHSLYPGDKKDLLLSKNFVNTALNVSRKSFRNDSIPENLSNMYLIINSITRFSFLPKNERDAIIKKYSLGFSEDDLLVMNNLMDVLSSISLEDLTRSHQSLILSRLYEIIFDYLDMSFTLQRIGFINLEGVVEFYDPNQS